jgi:hypothetical protein
LLCVVLGDSQRFEFFREEQVAKPRREAGKPSLSPTVADFFRRSSPIFWQASKPPCEALETWLFVWPRPPRSPPPPALLLAPWLELPPLLPPPPGSR